MPTPTSMDEFSTRLADPDMSASQPTTEHPRFIQVRCRLDGTHPDVQVGQVWEDLDTRRAADGARHVMVTEVNDDGTVDVVNVFLGEGSSKNVGVTSTIAVYRFRSGGSGRGFRLRSLVIHLNDTGRPRQGFDFPAQVSLTDFIKPDSVTGPPVLPPLPAPTPSAATAPGKTKPQPSQLPTPVPTPVPTAQKVTTPVTSSPTVTTLTVPTGEVAATSSGSEVLQGVLTTTDKSSTTPAATTPSNRFKALTDILSGGEQAVTLPIHRKMATRLVAFMNEEQARTFARQYTYSLTSHDFPDTPTFLSDFVTGARRWAHTQKVNANARVR